MSRVALLAILGLLSPVAKAEDTSAIAAAVYTHLAKQGDGPHSPFHVFISDLNDDGHTDALVILRSNEWCGSGGCNALVFRGTEKGFSYVSGSTVTNEPVMVSPEKLHGWHTLIVSTGGVGPVIMEFDGHGYPSNPSLQRAASAQKVKQAHALTKELVGN